MPARPAATPTGIAVTIDGTAGEYAAQADAIDALIASLTYEEPAP